MDALPETQEIPEEKELIIKADDSEEEERARINALLDIMFSPDSAS